VKLNKAAKIMFFVLTLVAKPLTANYCNPNYRMEPKCKKVKLSPKKPWRPIGLSEMLWIRHRLDSLLTDGGKVVSLKHRPHSTPSKHNLSASGTHFCLSIFQGLKRLEGLGKLKKSFTFSGLEPATFRLVV
jgi:hypothetical protein